MRILALVVLFLTFTLTACAAPGSEPAAAVGPRLSLAMTTLELGEMPNGEIARREVAVVNDGDAPLVVDAVTTSCGCTTAALEPMTLAPGQTGTLTIAFDSGAHGPDLRGDLMRQVMLSSNDPAQPETIVELRATIVGPEETADFADSAD